ncbi:Vps53-like protein [Pyronema omphalodes]|nr:Vps53-like protein [Pyronema omphalodes]
MARVQELRGESLPDPLDAADYDPIDHLNSLFAHPAALASVTPVARSLDTHLNSLDAEISALVSTQAATNTESLSRISAAKADLSELFDNIDTVRARAMRTEEAITAMTADIKKLDSTKRNLTLSMTMLKRLQMLTTAFEQLKANTKMRQYRECASLLAAVLELMAHFKSYRSIAQIATLSRNVADLKAELLEQVCEDFEMAFVKNEVASKKGMLSEACAVIDALGDMAKQRIIGWYCNAELREYRQVFRGNDEAGSLDNISRRYAWFKRMLKTYDEEHAAIFPASWKVNEVLASSYCEGTKDDFKSILQRAMRREGGQSLDVNLLLSALQETLDFELYLERRFSGGIENRNSGFLTSTTHLDTRASMDTVSSKDNATTTSFGKTISEAFEPYLSLWVEAQEKALALMMPKYRASPLRPPDAADEDFVPTTAVHPSSIELFHFYRLTLSQCAKLSTGSKLLDLSKIFAKYLDTYAESVLGGFLNPPGAGGAGGGAGADALKIEDIAIILNTADYCYTTTSQLADKIKSRLSEPSLIESVDLTPQRDSFLSVINRVLSLLSTRVTSALEPSWREMRNSPWSRMETVGDQSGYLTPLLSALRQSAGDILDVIAKFEWRRAFASRLVEVITTKFLENIVLCRPIGSVGAEQMLLDSYVLKKALEELPTLRPPAHAHADDPPPQIPQSYLKHVARSFAKLDSLLKTLQVSINPAEGIVQAYLIHIGDSNLGNFKKILDLKGVRKSEQQGLGELFKVHVPAHDGLVESSPVMNQVVIGGLPTDKTQGPSISAGLSAGGFGDLSAVLAAARDGVDTLRQEGEQGGLGKFFRRDAQGKLRFGQEER